MPKARRQKAKEPRASPSADQQVVIDDDLGNAILATSPQDEAHGDTPPRLDNVELAQVVADDMECSAANSGGAASGALMASDGGVPERLSSPASQVSDAPAEVAHPLQVIGGQHVDASNCGPSEGPASSLVVEDDLDNSILAGPPEDESSENTISRLRNRQLASLIADDEKCGDPNPGGVASVPSNPSNWQTEEKVESLSAAASQGFVAPLDAANSDSPAFLGTSVDADCKDVTSLNCDARDGLPSSIPTDDHVDSLPQVDVDRLDASALLRSLQHGAREPLAGAKMTLAPLSEDASQPLLPPANVDDLDNSVLLGAPQDEEGQECVRRLQGLTLAPAVCANDSVNKGTSDAKFCGSSPDVVDYSRAKGEVPPLGTSPSIHSQGFEPMEAAHRHGGNDNDNARARASPAESHRSVSPQSPSARSTDTMASEHSATQSKSNVLDDTLLLDSKWNELESTAVVDSLNAETVLDAFEQATSHDDAFHTRRGAAKADVLSMAAVRLRAAVARLRGGGVRELRAAVGEAAKLYAAAGGSERLPNRDVLIQSGIPVDEIERARVLLLVLTSLEEVCREVENVRLGSLACATVVLDDLERLLFAWDDLMQMVYGFQKEVPFPIFVYLDLGIQERSSKVRALAKEILGHVEATIADDITGKSWGLLLSKRLKAFHTQDRVRRILADLQYLEDKDRKVEHPEVWKKQLSIESKDGATEFSELHKEEVVIGGTHLVADNPNEYPTVVSGMEITFGGSYPEPTDASTIAAQHRRLKKERRLAAFERDWQEAIFQTETAQVRQDAAIRVELLAGAACGERVLSLSSVRGLTVGATIKINPNGMTDEDVVIASLDPFLIDRPLDFTHIVGEEVVCVGRPRTQISIERLRELWDAVRRGNLGDVAFVVGRGGVNCKAMDAEGNTALSIALMRGHLGIACYLVEVFHTRGGFDPDTIDRSTGDTILHMLARCGFFDEKAGWLLRLVVASSPGVLQRKNYKGKTFVDAALTSLNFDALKFALALWPSEVQAMVFDESRTPLLHLAQGLATKVSCSTICPEPSATPTWCVTPLPSHFSISNFLVGGSKVMTTFADVAFDVCSEGFGEQSRGLTNLNDSFRAQDLLRFESKLVNLGSGASEVRRCRFMAHRAIVGAQSPVLLDHFKQTPMQKLKNGVSACIYKVDKRISVVVWQIVLQFLYVGIANFEFPESDALPRFCELLIACVLYALPQKLLNLAIGGLLRAPRPWHKVIGWEVLDLCRRSNAPNASKLNCVMDVAAWSLLCHSTLTLRTPPGSVAGTASLIERYFEAAERIVSFAGPVAASIAAGSADCWIEAAATPEPPRPAPIILPEDGRTAECGASADNPGWISEGDSGVEVSLAAVLALESATSVARAAPMDEQVGAWLETSASISPEPAIPGSTDGEYIATIAALGSWLERQQDAPVTSAPDVGSTAAGDKQRISSKEQTPPQTLEGAPRVSLGGSLESQVVGQTAAVALSSHIVKGSGTAASARAGTSMPKAPSVPEASQTVTNPSHLSRPDSAFVENVANATIAASYAAIASMDASLEWNESMVVVGPHGWQKDLLRAAEIANRNAREALSRSKDTPSDRASVEIEATFPVVATEWFESMLKAAADAVSAFAGDEQQQRQQQPIQLCVSCHNSFVFPDAQFCSWCGTARVISEAVLPPVVPPAPPSSPVAIQPRRLGISEPRGLARDWPIA